MKEKELQTVLETTFEALLKQVNDIKRPALEFHHEDLLGRLDDQDTKLAILEAKLDTLKDLILDKRDVSFQRPVQGYSNTGTVTIAPLGSDPSKNWTLLGDK